MEKLQELGLDPKQFGLHNLRSGGASAATNAGVPDHWFKRHMEDGFLRMPRTAMSRTNSKTGSTLPEVWAYNIFAHSTSYFL